MSRLKVSPRPLSGKTAGRRNSSLVFGNVDSDDELPGDKNTGKVVIHDIDQYLRDNPDPIEYNRGPDAATVGEVVEDFSNIDVEKLVIPNLAVPKDVQEYIARRIMTSEAASHDTDEEATEKEAQDRLYYYKQYVAKYLALLSYYDRDELVWRMYIEWIQRHQGSGLPLQYQSEQIEEVGADEMDTEMDDGEMETDGHGAIESSTLADTTGYYTAYDNPDEMSID